MDHKFQCNLSKRQQNVIRSMFFHDELRITVYYAKRKRMYMAYVNDGGNKVRLFAARFAEDFMSKMRQANEVNPGQDVRWNCANERAKEAWPFAPTGFVR